MKRLYLLLAVLIIVGLTAVLARKYRDSSKLGLATSQTNNSGEPVSTRPHGEPDSQTSGLRDRQEFLEKLGHAPENARSPDWILAQKTTWWGKRLNPEEFWRNRIVWVDNSARYAAMSHGRLYPPLPYNDSQFDAYSDKDDTSPDVAVEGPSISFYSTFREKAFWDHFDKTHPTPPDELERKQLEVATRVFESRKWINTTPKDISDFQKSIRAQAVSLNYPPEALTDDALFWSYVMHRREEYDNLINNGQPINSIPIQNLVNQLAVNPEFITKPLLKQQIQIANAWKAAYLQRLRLENVDESYINGYLKAWNLSPAEVFESMNHP